MITLRDFYHVTSNVVPLYVALILGFASVKWLKMFNAEQCSGISKFVSKFAVPLLSFIFIATNNPYTITYRFMAADTLQKVVVLVVLALWSRFSSKGSLEWFITLFSVSTLPSIIVMGVPMLSVMYGHNSDSLLVETVVLQYLVWFTMLLFLLEFTAARVSVSREREALPLGGLKGINANVGGDVSSGDGEAKDRPMFVRSLSAPSYVFRAGVADQYGPGGVPHSRDNGANGEEPPMSKQGSSSNTELRPKAAAQGESKLTVMLSATVTSHILITVLKKLSKNPNTYASLIGLAWSLISFRWNVELPSIISGSVKIISDGALGMAMFSLGLFMGMQPKIIACGKVAAASAAGMRFIIGPVVMAAASLAVGLRGTVLHIAIVQAALPLGIVTFVYAKEYNVHPDIQSTGIIFGMLIALPITLVYYILLGL